MNGILDALIHFQHATTRSWLLNEYLAATNEQFFSGKVPKTASPGKKFLVDFAEAFGYIFSNELGR